MEIDLQETIVYVIPGLVIIITAIFGDNLDLLIAVGSAIVLQIGFVYQKMNDSLDDVESTLDGHSSILDNQATVEPIREPNFYNNFLIDVRNARRRVFITYFKNESPYTSHDQETLDYYNDLNDIIEEKGTENVQFRRIVRGLPELEDWINRLLETHEENHNYSLGCILDNEDNEHLRGRVPVQLIDDDVTYFVAVGEQRETNGPRDMVVRSSEVNTQWVGYYERLWANSLTLMDCGRIQQDQVEKFHNHIDQMQENSE